MTEAALRPRTKSERMAFLSGYTMAIQDIEKHGVDMARQFLRTIAESEKRDNERKAGAV